ncbi:MAG: hypothetical protein ACXWFO_07305, partial [Candidatus Aminicenantales bacterium]
TPKGTPETNWTDANKEAFLKAVREGKGLVVFHFASSAFAKPNWEEFEKAIQDRMTAAESDLRQAQSTVDSLKKRLESLQAKEAVGMISNTEVQQAQFGLSYAQAQLSLALLEKDVLSKIK